MTHALQITTPSDKEVRIVRTFQAPRPRVFDCWTKPELLKQWLTGPPGWRFEVCAVDLRVGGGYRFVWKGPEGAELGSSGIYREIEVPHRLVNTEKYDQDWTGGETLVTLEMNEDQGQTVVAITVLYASLVARDGAMATGMTRGMDASFDHLDDVLKRLR